MFILHFMSNAEHLSCFGVIARFLLGWGCGHYALLAGSCRTRVGLGCRNRPRSGNLSCRQSITPECRGTALYK